MTYILSITHADDDVEIWVGGVQIKGHSYDASAMHQKGPWQFEAQYGDQIIVKGWDNYGGCRSIGAITLGHVESNQTQQLFEGVDLHCGFPPIYHWPVYDPAVQFFTGTYTIAIPTPAPPGPDENEGRELEFHCLLAAL